MIKILFVCHGNICRSVMAEFILKDLAKKQNRLNDFEIDSCATSLEEIGNDIDYRVQACLKKHGVMFTSHKARRITNHDLEYFDLIFVMDNENMYGLRRLFGSELDKYKNKIQLLLGNREVSDPWYTGQFESTYNDCIKGCNNILLRN